MKTLVKGNGIAIELRNDQPVAVRVETLPHKLRRVAMYLETNRSLKPRHVSIDDRGSVRIHVSPEFLHANFASIERTVTNTENGIHTSLTFDGIEFVCVELLPY